MPLAAIYPGTFDPITNGHIDLAERGARLFDRLVVSIAASPNKQPLFTLEERIHLAQAVLAHVPNVEVQGFSSLLVEHARTVGARVLLRGLRAVSDFEFEFQLASTNRRLDAGIETVFLTPTEQHTFISSSIVREVAKLGGSVDTFVHPLVQAALREKWGH